MPEAHLPLDMARCQPLACRQSDRCARATDWPTGDHVELSVIDASVCLSSDRGAWCAMFIDRRGLALQPQETTACAA